MSFVLEAVCSPPLVVNWLLNTQFTLVTNPSSWRFELEEKPLQMEDWWSKPLSEGHEDGDWCLLKPVADWRLLEASCWFRAADAVSFAVVFHCWCIDWFSWLYCLLFTLLGWKWSLFTFAYCFLGSRLSGTPLPRLYCCIHAFYCFIISDIVSVSAYPVGSLFLSVQERSMIDTRS